MLAHPAGEIDSMSDYPSLNHTYTVCIDTDTTVRVYGEDKVTSPRPNSAGDMIILI